MTDRTSPVIDESRVAEARAAVETAFDAVAAYIPADAAARADSLAATDPKGAVLAFRSLQRLYVPEPEQAKLRSAMKEYYRVRGIE